VAGVDDKHGDDKPWTFLTNHARVLVRIANDPNIRIRDIAGEIGITERTAQQIVTDLEQAGYLTRDRVGRRNLYTLAADAALRHPADSDRDLRTLIALLTDTHGLQQPDAGQAEPLADRLTSTGSHRTVS
jgi:DNA-binding MarR family transcriptional regulator